MEQLRSWAGSRRWLAVCLIAATIAAKLLVPQGFMVVAGGTTTLEVTLCSGAVAKDMTITVPAKDDQSRSGSGKALNDQLCPFAALGYSAFPVTDLAILLEAIAFVLALGLALQILLPLPRPAFLTPPLRGPPALI